jgi:hypothetical protein
MHPKMLVTCSIDCLPNFVRRTAACCSLCTCCRLHMQCYPVAATTSVFPFLHNPQQFFLLHTLPSTSSTSGLQHLVPAILRQHVNACHTKACAASSHAPVASASHVAVQPSSMCFMPSSDMVPAVGSVRGNSYSSCCTSNQTLQD